MDATDGHHMFGRMNDVPEAIIALCRTCHTDVHDGRLLNVRIIQIQYSRGILDGRRIWELERNKRIGSSATA